MTLLCIPLVLLWLSEGSILANQSNLSYSIMADAYSPFTPALSRSDTVADNPLGSPDRRTDYGSTVSNIPVLKTSIQPRSANAEQRDDWKFAIAEAISVNTHDERREQHE